MKKTFIKALPLSLLLVGAQFTSTGQNLVVNGDFEVLTPIGMTSIANQCVWAVAGQGVTQGVQADPIGGGYIVEFAEGWLTHRNGSGQGIDFHVDARPYNSSYFYDDINHLTCLSSPNSEFFFEYDTPGESGTYQTTGPAMLVDANTSNSFYAYPEMEASNTSTMATHVTNNDFIEGRFTQELDLFKRYQLSFQYSIPCDEGVTVKNTDNRIIFNLFDSEWQNLLGANYTGSYLYVNNSINPMADIDSDCFYWDVAPGGPTGTINTPASHRLPILDMEIDEGIAPCEWHTVTVEFCIADLMNDPANSNLANNSLFAGTPIGFMHNSHMWDIDYHAANVNGWPYSFNSPTTSISDYIADYLSDGSMTLYDFKNIFGVTLKGLQDIYIDDIQVHEIGCNLDATFTVEQECSTDENGNHFVTFTLNPNGSNSNPYMFQWRSLTNGGAFTTINNTYPLTGTHTLTIPYQQGEQIEFKMGTWTHADDDCNWIETRQTHQVDPNGDWFPVEPKFSATIIQHYILPTSMFGLIVDPTPGFEGVTSEWHIRVNYAGAVPPSSWMTVSTQGNPTGDGNGQFVMWFDCESNFSILNLPAQLQNVSSVDVRRTNYGSCDEEGLSKIWRYSNCEITPGRSAEGVITSAQFTKDRFDELKKQLNLDDNVFQVMGESLLDFEMYPNPTSEVVNLQFDGQDARTITVTNLQGQKVMENIVSGNSNVVIDVEEIPTGVYLITVVGTNNTLTKKLIKE